MVNTVFSYVICRNNASFEKYIGVLADKCSCDHYPGDDANTARKALFAQMLRLLKGRECAISEEVGKPSLKNKREVLNKAGAGWKKEKN